MWLPVAGGGGEVDDPDVNKSFGDSQMCALPPC
jgi:hypothetical protein